MHTCFFFQAEDGIRDKLVTGVQTCALPISVRRAHPRPSYDRRDHPAAPARGLAPGDDVERDLPVGELLDRRDVERARPGTEIGRASCREKSVDLRGSRCIKKRRKTT